MAPPFLIVPVGDDSQFQAIGAQKVQPGLPVGVLADFVDFVDRQGIGAGRDGHRAGEGQDRAPPLPGDDALPGPRPRQMTDGVGGTSRSHKDVVGLQEGGGQLGVIGAEGAVPPAGRHDGHLGMVVLQPVLDELRQAARHPGGVGLESRRGLQDGDPNGRPQAAEEILVHPPARRGCLSGAEEGNEAGVDGEMVRHTGYFRLVVSPAAKRSQIART